MNEFTIKDPKTVWKEFQCWVRRLSWTELEHALEFVLRAESALSSTSTDVGHRWVNKQQSEYDFLRELVQLQAPPPTPIHPRAIQFSIASQENRSPNGRRSEVERLQKERLFCPRLFRCIESVTTVTANNGSISRKKKHHYQQNTAQYHIQVRHFRTASGERLSLGCTLEQQDADIELLRGTNLVYSMEESSRVVVTYRYNSSTISDDQLGCDDQKKGAVLRILMVASRGQFLSKPYMFSQVPPSSNSKRIVTAPWLDVIDRWFSLSMFLASRFEVALWTTFCQQRTGTLTATTSINSCDASTLCDDRIKLESAKALWRELLLTTLPLESPFGGIRDTLMWNLLGESEADQLFQCLRPDNTRDLWTTIALLDLGLPLETLLCRLRQIALVSMARMQEESLLSELQQQELALGKPQLSKSIATNGLTSQKHKGRKGSRNKNKNRKLRHYSTNLAIAATVFETEAEDEADTSSEHSDSEVKSNALPIQVPEKRPVCARERNRNIILVLSILEDTLHQVHVQAERNSMPSLFLGPIAEEEKSNCTESRFIAGSSLSPTANRPEGDRSSISDDVINSLSIPNKSSFADSGMCCQVVKPILEHTKQSPESEIYQRTEPLSFTWEGSDLVVDEWGRMRGVTREESLLTEFFLSQQENKTDDHIEQVMASSTAASVDSMSNHEQTTGERFDDDEVLVLIEAPVTVHDSAASTGDNNDGIHSSQGYELPTITDMKAPTSLTLQVEGNLHDDFFDDLPPPSTPSPRLSPILLTLADLQQMRRNGHDQASPDEAPFRASSSSMSSSAAMSVPLPPKISLSRQCGRSSSREDLRSPSLIDDTKNDQRVSPSLTEGVSRSLGNRLNKSRDDHDIRLRASMRKSVDALSTYRNVTVKVLTSRDDNDIRHLRAAPLPTSSYRAASTKFPVKSSASITTTLSAFPKKTSWNRHFDASVDEANRASYDCALSEIVAHGNDDYQHWNDSRQSPNDDFDTNTVTKDGSTTITSALSQGEAEQVQALREERDAYRDLCLTLGAEVAKLKTMLAAQKTTVFEASAGCFTQMHTDSFGNPAMFDPLSVPRVYPTRPNTLAAMSDFGFRADQESQASEDETARAIRPPGSDASVDFNSIQPLQMVHKQRGTPPTRDVHDPVTLNGMQSRLTLDILRFLDATNIKLRKLAPCRRLAIERISRLVNAVWPRAQVKLYGSSVTGLSLPSSDLDFVICLPAVHKKAIAVAPGVLEGRNAINETSQKLLARRLKGESWIDPRSIKLIERTAVPVIKVSTKDTKARTLQLDITFDSTGHYGLNAVHMMTQIMEELPMIRPLVLVLKQFLSDRGLLTAYTGGLSSYCLFLMVARYLQEQHSSWGDAGSLLIGFLDYYGNAFDPRSKGISVRSRCYFARLNEPFTRHPDAGHHLWAPHALGQQSTFYRRNSFSDKGNVDSIRAGPVRYQVAVTGHHHLDGGIARVFSPEIDQNPPFPLPFTLDPLFVEDPLDATNNVGRNAFRIFSVLRAFSDAHRALLASLEWDFSDSSESLLKCLLQTDDVVYNDI